MANTRFNKTVIVGQDGKTANVNSSGELEVSTSVALGNTKIEGSTSANVAEVDSSNQLKTIGQFDSSNNSHLSTLTSQGTANGITLDAIKNAVELLDNFISGSKGLVTEDNSSAILADTTAIKNSIQLLDNAISGSEMQVDIVTQPNGTKDFKQNQDTIIKHYSWTTAQTDYDLWTPSLGKKFVICDIIISIDVACVVLLKDETTQFFKGTFVDDGGLVSNQSKEIISSTINQDCKLTTSAGGEGSITLVGYEI